MTSLGDIPLGLRLREARRRGLLVYPLTATLERLLCDRSGFGLVTATPVQRAICRIADGLPLGELADDPGVAEALGCDPHTWVPVSPRILGIFSGVRTGKSLLAAALAVRASQSIDVSPAGAGETPRVSVLSLTVDKAKVILDHIKSRVRGQSALSWLILGCPTKDTILLEHPSGRPVEVMVTAGSKAGAATIARWSAGVILDEAPRMNSAEDGVVNMDDVLHASHGRMLPGAQIVAIGSPWAPHGPCYSMVQDRHGHPGVDGHAVVWCRANLLNPQWWTEERESELLSHDPVAHKTDFLAQFADSVTGMFDPDAIDRSVRPEPIDLEPIAGHRYQAAMDPATRANAWTLVIGSKDRSGKWVVSIARQWRARAGVPLSPSLTMEEIAELCRRYRVSIVHSDQFSGDALKDLAVQNGISVNVIPTTSTLKVQWYTALARCLDDGRLELPLDRDLVIDLKRVRKRTTQAGISIDLPHTPDRRHCDYAPAVALLVGRRSAEPDEEPEQTEDDEYLAELARRQAQPFWRQ